VCGGGGGGGGIEGFVFFVFLFIYWGSGVGGRLSQLAM
jgi:hypothetical protein